MNLDEGLTTLDPAFASSRNPLWMTEQVFNGLVELDSALRLQASLARSWDLSANGKTYTFHLRGDVFFHRDPCFGAAETRKMKASDFVYSLTRICQPALASPGLWVFNGKVVGVGEFREGKALTISGFRAPDDSTFVIELNEAFPPFLSLLAMPYGYVVPYEAVDYYGDRFREHPVGTGPFRIYRWNEGQRLILHKNPAYFEWENGLRLPGVDAVSVSFIPSRLSAFIEFVQGKLDFVGDLDNSYRDELLYPDGSLKEAYAEKYQFLMAPQLNTEYLAFQVDQSLDQVKNHPLSDVRIRKAINYAIDRQKLVKYLLNGMGYPAESGFIPFGMPGFDSLAVRGYTFDPDAARRLLGEAGYPGGRGLPPLVLNSTQKYEHISEFIQKSLENVGIRVQVQNMQGGALRAEARKSALNFWRASWIGDYPDGENYLSLFYGPNHSPKGPNVTHYRSARFDSLYRRAMAVPGDSLRQSLYREMDQEMISAAPIVPLYYDRSFRMLQRGITGLGSNPMNHLSLKRVRKD